MQVNEDVHFLIDNAPPNELEFTIRSLDTRSPRSIEDLRSELSSTWGYSPQKHYSNTIRRLQDLGITTETYQDKNSLILTDLGTKIQQLLDSSPMLCPDIFHYLHYSGLPKIRKLFLSYKWCCQSIWVSKEMLSASELVGIVQSKIEIDYPNLYEQKKGGNFNAGGVSAWRAWISRLEPPLLSDDPKDKKIYPREISSFQLILLGLTSLYQNRGYRFGDPVLMDNDFFDELTGIFFLDNNCCRSLITLATKVTRHLTIRDSFAGTTVTMLKPFTLEDF